MSGNDFNALAVRCELAKTNDLRLFREIGWAAFGTIIGHEDGETQYSVDDIGPEHWRYEELLGHDAFLEAALLLKPQGLGVHLRHSLRGEERPTAEVHLTRIISQALGGHGHYEAEQDIAEGYAATPALAFSAAALRARARPGEKQ